MTERVEEYRDSVAIYTEMFRNGERDPWMMLNIVDERLAQISNCIASCHGAIAKHNALAGQGFLQWHREKHLADARDVSDTLADVFGVQEALFVLRGEVLGHIAKHYRRLDPE